MKRNNPPSTGASESRASSSPAGLTLDSASVWQKRDVDQAAAKPAATSGAAPEAARAKPIWNRYADSRLRQFSCR